MKKVIFTFGISGCGKSTWLADKSPVVETDEIRKTVYGDVNDTEHDAEVFETAKANIVTLLETNDTVYFGSTMVETKHRVPFLEDIQTLCPVDVEFELVIFKSDPIVSKQRVQADLDNNVERANTLAIIDTQHEFYMNALIPLQSENMYSNIQYVGF